MTDNRRMDLGQHIKNRFKNTFNNLQAKLNCSLRFVRVSLILMISAVCLIFFLQPKVSYYTMDFELLFDGLSIGRYPNALLFNVNDILSQEIIRDAYEKNKISKYMEFDDFNNSLTIIQNNDTPYKLQDDFFSRLRNPDLNPNDRIWLEEEYLSKLESAYDPNYTFLFLPGKCSIPATVVTGIFEDILKGWSRLSLDERGVQEYQIPIVTSNILRYNDYLNIGENWFIFIDKTRNIINYVRDNIKSLSEIPSSSRILSEEGISISDIEFRLNALDRHKLVPLSFLMFIDNETEKYYIDLYLDNIISYLETNLILLNNIKDIYDRSFEMYMNIYSDTAEDTGRENENAGAGASLRSRIGISVLDNIINIARKNVDYEFRQNIINKSMSTAVSIAEIEKSLSGYRHLKSNLSNNPFHSKNSGNDPADNEFIEKSIREISATLSLLISRLDSLYHRISVSDLANDEHTLYTTDKGAKLIREEKMGFIKIALVCMVIWLFLISFRCVIIRRGNNKPA